jgi:hypothetical protein
MKPLFFIHIIHWLEANQLSCPSKKILQVDCPGCGLQRSFIELLKGNLQSSLQFHPATIPLLLFFLFAALQLKFQFKQGYKIIVYGYIIVATILTTNYIYKIIHLV